MSATSEVLDFMAAHPKSWFTKGQLQEAIGGQGFSMTSLMKAHPEVQMDKLGPRRSVYRWAPGNKRPARKASVASNGHVHLGEALLVVGLILGKKQGDPPTVMVRCEDGTVKELHE